MRRKNIRLARGSYEISSQIFSVTICTWNRRSLFRNATWANLVLTSLETGHFRRQTRFYAFCLMPDHVHIQLSPMEANLVDLVSRWKSFTANLLRRDGLIGPCWQRGFYDHVLRKEEDIRTSAECIVNNPVHADFVENWVYYPFAWHRWI